MELDDTDGRGAGRLQRTLSIRDVEADTLTEAWRRPDVQRALVCEFAELLGGDTAAMRWRVHVPVFGAVETLTRELEYVPGRCVRHVSTATGRPDVLIETGLSLREGPVDRGIEATLHLYYQVPGGVLADIAMKWFGAAPDVLVGRVLRRFKAYMEAGEIPTLSRNPAARDDN